VFHDFEERRIDVLICTTYIEEAPVVPNAIAMVIEHADSHELIRLHRLRGHVGHGRKGGVCLLITSENPTDAGLARVQQVMSESDGFRIAEIDLRERGASVILGERARELPVFCWTDPVQDRALLLSAREESFGIVREDPSMRRWADFGRAIHYRWGRWLGPGLPDPSTAKSGGSGGGRRRRRRRR
jgi:ATP-dependent DNA helicase RecG